MKELNIIIISTLIALFIWIGVETTQVSPDTALIEKILESYPPFDVTIDTDYLSKLEAPAYVQY